ncbi:MAG: nucleotidyl transferase AbiEii/AbiGii toxin family protein [Polyangiaceae bacterium]|nr:nucleotidyl transferase AbiEii/AbiGii toxin family protein [Polyangiaceae bacterium]
MKRPKGEPPRNMAASVKTRLMSVARERNEDFNFLLNRYVLERILYRLTQSPHAGTFLLKGAMLFTVWSQRPHRATKDIDLLGYGSPDVGRLEAIFRDVCEVQVQDDGLVFLAATVKAEPIREDAVYDGIRVTFEAKLGTAKVPVQVDVGFGDATTPPPELVEIPPLLDLPPPVLQGYRRELVVAEKFHAMVDLGIANSRMKDFFDIWFLSRHFPFDGPTLAAAITATFARRKTPIPSAPPLALTDTFAQDTDKLAQWVAFTKRARIDQPAPSLQEIVGGVSHLLMPVVEAVASGRPWDETWTPGDPWEKPLPARG